MVLKSEQIIIITGSVVLKKTLDAKLWLFLNGLNLK